jgi:DNA modification methylase
MDYKMIAKLQTNLEIIQGDCFKLLQTLPDESVNCCVTSPPYWGLRDYRVKGQIGLEASIEEYVAKIVNVFREVKRILKKDGTCWINLGDSYNSPGPNRHDKSNIVHKGKAKKIWSQPSTRLDKELKSKELCGIPWRIAFALQKDGWYLRQDIIWAKPNPMPESVQDRCTKAHEYLFLLTKSTRYYYDQEAIKEPLKDASIFRLMQNIENQKGSDRVSGKRNGTMKAVCQKPAFGWRQGKRFNEMMAGGGTSYKNGHSGYFDSNGQPLCGSMANKRSVWTVPTFSFKEAHFATYPPDLIKPCILAGCPVGGTVLDPFAGSGTTGQVALELGRRAILIELNSNYIELINQRCHITPGFEF